MRERGGGPMPARLTFVPSGGGRAKLFESSEAAPRELAARDDVVYTRSGRGRITVPPGEYTLVASRGLEWGLARAELALVAGETTSVELELARELDTAGWIGADFHLHTLTHSGHGDATVEERLISCAGEGLDLAVATDHDHHTDYGPELRALRLDEELATLVGNEVSTPVGHFNAFPLDPARAPVDSSLTDANELFRLIRAAPGAGGAPPVIQLNHPRLKDIDAFTKLGLDPVTGTSSSPAWSRDFDSIEVLNENLALGYRDPVADGADTRGHAHSVLADWFRLLDLGERYAAVGNSDSHHVREIVAGYPRNFVRVDGEDAASVDGAEVAAAVRAKRLFTTTGPFLECRVEGADIGGDARALEGHARLELRVRAASWVDCDRAKVFVNGALEATVPIHASTAEVRLERELVLCLRGACEEHARARPSPAPFDAWVVVVVEGDDSLAPLLAPEARPLAIANPIWVDGDGDGAWTAPRARVAKELAAQATPDIARKWFARIPPVEQAHALALAPRGPFLAVLVEDGLAASERDVRLAAARACERMLVGGAPPGILRAFQANPGDPYLGALLVRVLALGAPERTGESLGAYAARFGEGALRFYAHELAPLLAAGGPPPWQALGPFDSRAVPRAEEGPPPREPPWPAGIEAASWRDLPPPSTGGFTDLAALEGAGATTRVYLQTFLRVPAARTVRCTFGSDDGGTVWLGERRVYENPKRKSASPLEALLALELEPGWNRVVLEIENATGEFGFYFRVLDSSVEAASAPR